MIDFFVFFGICAFFYFVLITLSELLKMISGGDTELSTLLLSIIASIAIAIALMTGGM